MRHRRGDVDLFALLMGAILVVACVLAVFTMVRDCNRRSLQHFEEQR
jgi:hypothetical protein